ncbi:hypothetical protein ACJX0J_000846, partial (mitochondrion) [Zea mays]
FLHVWSFVWIQSAKPTLLTILCALANWARLLTDWINRISKLSSYDFRLISLLIEYLDKQAQNKELRQLYQRWTNRMCLSLSSQLFSITAHSDHFQLPAQSTSLSWNDGKDYLFPVDELGKERSQGISLSFLLWAPLATFFPLVPYLCSAFNNKTFALNCFSKDLHWANLNLFTSLLFETTPPNSFDNTGLTDLGWKFAGTLWACKDKVDIIGIERTWFMERIGGGHFHFNVAVGKYSFTKLEYDRVLFLALVNAQYLFNEEMNNRKSTILQIENVWCQRI